jgi:hypothetical protein
MPKDRRIQKLGHLAGGIVILTLSGAGCRNTRPEVPPERPYITPEAAGATAGGRPHVSFSSEPPPAGNALGTAAGIAQGLPGTAGAPGAPPTFSHQPPGYGPATTPAAPPQAEPLQDMPGLGPPPGSGGPPRGVMGTPGALPSPL